MKKRGTMIAAGLFLLFLVQASAFGACDSEEPQIPVPGQVNMIVLGKHNCRACRLMRPVLEELRDKYSGRANVALYEIGEHPELGERFEVKITPTILLYDANGTLVERDEGYMKESVIVDKLSALGVAPPQ